MVHIWQVCKQTWFTYNSEYGLLDLCQLSDEQLFVLKQTINLAVINYKKEKTADFNLI